MENGFDKITNFHTHTYLCRHASGEVRDYILEASKDGDCAALGFSDHVPLPDGVWSGTRMSVDQLEPYLESVRQARADFPVYAGFECEWSPRYAGWYADLRGVYGADYLVFGPHWVEYEGECIYIPDVSERKLLRLYTEQTIAGIESGLFDFIAHPDILMLGHAEWDAAARECLIPILDAAVACGLPLEINGNGLIREQISYSKGLRAPYPMSEFWEEAAKRGAAVICNSDAHRPQDVLRSARLAREFARRFGFEPIKAPSAIKLNKA